MYRKLGRDSSARKALFRSMLTSFFQYERIETTEAKAKELRSLADQMVTLAKRGDLHARRQVLAYLMDESVVKKVSLIKLIRCCNLCCSTVFLLSILWYNRLV